MTKILISALTVVFSVGVAHSQTLGVSPSGSRASTVHAGYSPGTIGAMDEVAQGIATTPNDVAAQQGYHGMTAGYSPGTVGATPGR